MPGHRDASSSQKALPQAGHPSILVAQGMMRVFSDGGWINLLLEMVGIP
jgi:hypothetical protein